MFQQRNKKNEFATLQKLENCRFEKNIKLASGLNICVLLHNVQLKHLVLY